MSSNQEQSSKKIEKNEDDTSKKSKLKLSATSSQAGTSTSFQDTGKKSKDKDEQEKWGFFPQNMWFWKQEEPQTEVLLKNWSQASDQTLSGKNEKQPQPDSQQPVRKTESQYIWPDTVNIQEPQRIVNQPTLNQIIEQRKLRENQLIFKSQDFYKHVDYLGDRLTQSKLNILIAQLNEILPSSSQEHVDATKKLTRSKPLHVKESSQQQLRRKASQVSERLTPEEITQRKQLRQNQLEEYENLRDQIDLFEHRSSSKKINASNITSIENSEHIMDETISKTDLNKLIDLLNEMPSKDKTNTSLQKLIESKPRMLQIIKEAYKKTVEPLTPEEKARQEQLRQTQIQEYEDLYDQITLYEDKSMPTNFTTASDKATNIKRMSETIIEETLSKTKLEKLVTQLNEPTSSPKQESSKIFTWKSPKIAKSLTAEKKVKLLTPEEKAEPLTPEKIAKQKELRENQLQEYEKLREQIGLFGERRSDVTLLERKEIFLERTISKKELNLFINHLKELPNNFKTGPNKLSPSKRS